MSDDIDRAQEREEQIRNGYLEAQARKKAESYPPCGECYSCGEHLPDNRLFCNGLCASDHARAQRIRHQNGV